MLTIYYHPVQLKLHPASDFFDGNGKKPVRLFENPKN